MNCYELMIYKRDLRTKLGERLTGSYPYRRRCYQAMVRELAELTSLYPSRLGYRMVIATCGRDHNNEWINL